MHIFGQKEGTKTQLTIPQALGMILENQFHMAKSFKNLIDQLDVINANIFDLKKELEASNESAKHKKILEK